VQGVGYPRYDNFDAIEVPFVDAIFPGDYDAMMGVPSRSGTSTTRISSRSFGSSDGRLSAKKKYGPKERVVAMASV